MLTHQLRELEYHDIIHREVYHQIPPKVEYSISAYGQGLLPVLLAMQDWGMAHIKHFNDLYGEERSVEAFVSRIDEIAGN
jgi:DNA-binding HxlR family transcriptional regulator